jgi:hypothetical protein
LASRSSAADNSQGSASLQRQKAKLAEQKILRREEDAAGNRKRPREPPVAVSDLYIPRNKKAKVIIPIGELI